MNLVSHRFRNKLLLTDQNHTSQVMRVVKVRRQPLQSCVLDAKCETKSVNGRRMVYRVEGCQHVDRFELFGWYRRPRRCHSLF